MHNGDFTGRISSVGGDPLCRETSPYFSRLNIRLVINFIRKES